MKETVKTSNSSTKKKQENESDVKSKQVDRCSTPNKKENDLPRLSDQMNVSVISDTKTSEKNKKKNNSNNSTLPLSDRSCDFTKEYSMDISDLKTKNKSSISYSELLGHTFIKSTTIDTSDPPSEASKIMEFLGEEICNAIDLETGDSNVLDKNVTENINTTIDIHLTKANVEEGKVSKDLLEQETIENSIDRTELNEVDNKSENEKKCEIANDNIVIEILTDVNVDEISKDIQPTLQQQEGKYNNTRSPNADIHLEVFTEDEDNIQNIVENFDAQEIEESNETNKLDSKNRKDGEKDGCFSAAIQKNNSLDNTIFETTDGRDSTSVTDNISNHIEDPTFMMSTSEISDGNLSLQPDPEKKLNLPLLKNIKVVKMDKLTVPVSAIDGKRSKKVNYCPFCNKPQTKFARHILNVHRDQTEVAEISDLPPCNGQRLKVFESLRKYGNYIHNMDATVNSGKLITCRQAQEKYGKTAADYIICEHCKGYYSKKTIRMHYVHCNKSHKKGSREIMVQGRKILAQIHEEATDEFTAIFTKIHDDHISRTIAYDRLLVLYGNVLTEKYTEINQTDMIRQHLRLLGRLKYHMKTLDASIDDFASILNPKYYETMVKAAKICAQYDREQKSFKCPAVATAIGTHLKKIIHVHMTDCIKTGKKDLKLLAEDFLVVFNTEYPVIINKKALNDQAAQKRNKKIILPHKSDIQILMNYLEKKCEKYYNDIESNSEFNKVVWLNLLNATLILIQVFNRKRPGDIERLPIAHFNERTAIDANENPDLYAELSAEEKHSAPQYESIMTRGKRGRTVPILVNLNEINYINILLKNRIAAGVDPNNVYVFGIPPAGSESKPYQRTCPLLRKYSEECGATDPKSLRATLLRKQVATNTAMLRVADNDVSDLANFMGHEKAIHHGIYRQPLAVTDITRVSKLLKAASGKSGQYSKSKMKTLDNTTEDIYSNQNELDEQNYDHISKHNSCMNTSANSSGSNDSSTKNSSSSSTDSRKRCISSKKQKKGANKTRWTLEEKNVVRRCVGPIDKNTVLPSLEDCRKWISQYPILRGRTAEKLKSYISNRKQALMKK